MTCALTLHLLGKGTGHTEESCHEDECIGKHLWQYGLEDI